MSCTSEHCYKCNVPFIIKNHIDPLMRVLSNELHEFNMDMITTKCLNTGVILLRFILGKDGVNIANHCDSVQTRNKHINLIDSNVHVLDSLQKHVLSTHHRKRYLYYIMITDGYFKKDQNTIYFPGHVLLIEKNNETGHSKPLYYIYQSYINQYDLKGHFDNMNGNVEMSHDEMKKFLAKITYIVLNGLWDQRCVKYWHDITNVDSSQYLNSNTTNAMYMCYRSQTINGCLETLKTYVQETINSTNDTQLKNRLSLVLKDIQNESKPQKYFYK